MKNKISNNPSQFFYFFCEPLVNLKKHPEANTDYQHGIICLAEGLSKLGYFCYGNTNYWQSEVNSDYLIKKHTQDNIANAQAVIVASHWILKHNIPNIPSHIPIFLMADMQAEIYKILHLPNLMSFKKVLLSGYVSCYNYPKNITPWAFGLSNRIIKETDKNPSSTRANSILFNFRMEHTSRKLVKKYLKKDLQKIFEIKSDIDTEKGNTDYDALMTKQTGHRHYPNYFKTLSQVQAVAGFGGYFAPSFSKKRFSLINRLLFKLIRFFGLTTNCLIQHDSWRLWETLISGAILFHSDLDEANVIYPVQPKNFEHYVGIPRSFLRPHSQKKFLKFIPKDKFEHIAKKGQEFAREHYSPKPTALRFLEFLKN